MYPQLKFASPEDLKTVKEGRREMLRKHTWEHEGNGTFECRGCGKSGEIDDAESLYHSLCTPRRPRQAMTRKDVLARWPSLVAHLICVSLGYCTPGKAANIILDYINGRENGCEWLSACHKCQPAPVIKQSWTCRHHHKGYMADYRQALGLVITELVTGQGPVFASWF